MRVSFLVPLYSSSNSIRPHLVPWAAVGFSCGKLEILPLARFHLLFSCLSARLCDRPSDAARLFNPSM